MKRLTIALAFILSISICLLALSKEKEKEKEKKIIKLLDSQVEVVDLSESREVHYLMSETKMLMEETCKLHQLLIKEKSNERRESNTRATERRIANRRRDGSYCPTSSSSDTVTK